MTAHDPKAPSRPTPEVSVIMAVHNGLPYLETAVRSILGQTLQDLEFIVVDDASIDGSFDLLECLAVEDARLIPLRSPQNEGPAQARNRALLWARAPYVAVQDADDIAHPTRLQVQKDWLDRHPEVVLLGSSNRRIDAEGRVLKIEMRDLPPFLARWHARFGMPVVHPSVMFRRLDAARAPRLYDPEMPVAQDFDLVARALEQGEIASLPDVLVDWRAHETSISAMKRDQQRAAAIAITARVQARELPEERRRDIAEFTRVVLKQQEVTPAVVLRCFGAARRMLTEDLREAPEMAGPLKAHMGEMLIYYLGSHGIGRRRLVAMMLVCAPDLFYDWLGYRHNRRAHAVRSQAKLA